MACEIEVNILSQIDWRLLWRHGGVDNTEIACVRTKRELCRNHNMTRVALFTIRGIQTEYNAGREQSYWIWIKIDPFDWNFACFSSTKSLLCSGCAKAGSWDAKPWIIIMVPRRVFLNGRLPVFGREPVHSPVFLAWNGVAFVQSKLTVFHRTCHSAQSCTKA